MDYIDPDKVPRVPGGEDNAKNNFLFSLSELSYIFPEDVMNTLTPYLTVFGDGKINLNTADIVALTGASPGDDRGSGRKNKRGQGRQTL